MPDPISRLEVCQREVDRVFGADYARQHPDVVASVLVCATIDQAAARIAAAIELVAASLVEEAEPQQHIVPARELLRPRP